MKTFKKKMILGNLLSMMVMACGSSTKNDVTPDLPGPTSGDVTVYITTAARTQEFRKTYVDFGSDVNMSPRTILLNEHVKYQTMDGFGAAITGSTAYNLLKMKQADRTKFLKETLDRKSVV